VHTSFSIVEDDGVSKPNLVKHMNIGLLCKLIK